jgi:hypothetical protein
MSANEVSTGPSQVQTSFFTLDGDKLTVRTPEIASAALPGKKIVGTNMFERERQGSAGTQWAAERPRS